MTGYYVLVGVVTLLLIAAACARVRAERSVPKAGGSYDYSDLAMPGVCEGPIEAREFGAAARGRASISHTVIRACPRCRAPGVFSGEARIREGWSGCHVPEGDPREGTPVGDWCPNCGAPRAPDLTVPRGVVWRGTV